MKRLAITAVLVACGGGAPAKPTTPPPAPSQISCARAADGMVGLLMNGKEATEATDGYRKLIRDHCTADGWSPEAQRCWADAKTADDANVCGTLLTDDQAGALVKAQDQRQK